MAAVTSELSRGRHGKPAWITPQLTVGSLAVLIVVAVWASASVLIDSTRFPTPQDVIAAAIQITTTGYAGGSLLFHTLHSLKLVCLGFVCGVAVGLPLGIAMGWSQRTEAFLNPIFFFLKPIPPLAWIPLAIVWFGLGDAAKIFVIWFSSFVPILINSFTGVRMIEPSLISAGQVYGAKSLRMLWDVILPGAMPMIFGGLRISLQASWMALVAAELVGAYFGLGRVLMIASQDIYPGMIFVAMACVAIAGATLTKALGLLERIALPWMRPVQ